MLPGPASPLGLRRLHDVRAGGAQPPRPEGEVAPAALENGVHGAAAGKGPQGARRGDVRRLCPAPCRSPNGSDGAAASACPFRQRLGAAPPAPPGGAGRRLGVVHGPPVSVWTRG